MIYRDANLAIYPTKRTTANYTHLVIGDLDGNALKLIYILLREGIIDLSQTDYERLHVLYHKDIQHIKAKHIKEFKQILSKIRVIKRPSLHLLGDDLADRGHNDYFTLKLFEQLHEKCLPFDIVISNHTAAFIKDFETHKHLTGEVGFYHSQERSIINLVKLIKNGSVCEKEISDLLQSVYYPRLKMINYTVSEDKKHIHIYSHAPIGLETVKALAHQLNFPYSSRSIDSLTNTIDAINDYFHEAFVRHQFSNSYDMSQLYNHDMTQPLPLTDPVLRLIWNRALGEECTHDDPETFRVDFFHGHIGENTLHYPGIVNIHNMDSNFGKNDSLEKTDYTQAPCDSEVSYKVLELTKMFPKKFKSPYTSCIALINKLNRTIPEKAKQSVFHEILVDLIKKCEFDLLAHLDDVFICKEIKTILKWTLDFVEMKQTMPLKLYHSSIKLIPYDERFPLGLDIKQTMMKLAAHSHHTSPQPKAGILSRSMPIFSDPLKSTVHNTCRRQCGEAKLSTTRRMIL